MTVAQILVVCLFILGIVVGVAGIRMERRGRRIPAPPARPWMDDLARELRAEQDFMRAASTRIEQQEEAEVSE